MCGKVKTHSLFLPQQPESMCVCVCVSPDREELSSQQTSGCTIHGTMPWCKSSSNNFDSIKKTLQLLDRIFSPQCTFTISCNCCILLIKFAQGINVLFLIHCELFHIVWHKKILNHNTFSQLQVSELCSSFSNNCGSEFCYSDMINIQRQTFKWSIPKPTQSYPTRFSIK